MYCSKCGSENPDDNLFCEFCGAKLEDDDGLVSGTEVAADEEKETVDEETSENTGSADEDTPQEETVEETLSEETAEDDAKAEETVGQSSQDGESMDPESCDSDGEKTAGEMADNQETEEISGDGDGHDDKEITDQADPSADIEEGSTAEEDNDVDETVTVDDSGDTETSDKELPKPGILGDSEGSDERSSETDDDNMEEPGAEVSESEKDATADGSEGSDGSLAETNDSSDEEEPGENEPESEDTELTDGSENTGELENTGGIDTSSIEDADGDTVYVIGKAPAGKAETVTESTDSSATEPGNASRKKKKIIITCIVVFIVLVACAAALVLSFEHKASAEYRSAVKSADTYVKKKDYKKAAGKYLDAIDARPEEQDAYVKLADVYMKQKESGKAVKILEKGKTEAKEKKKIKEKLQHVKVYDTYSNYVENGILKDIDMTDEKETTSSSEYSSGLVSALLKDCDGDSLPELITAEFYDDYESKLVLSYYKCSGDKVSKTDQVSISLGKSNLIARKCSAFLKEYKDKWYLAVSLQGLYEEEEGNQMYIYCLDNGIMEHKLLLQQEDGIMSGTYYVNDTYVAGYAFDEDSEEGTEDAFDVALQQANAEGTQKFKDELKKYGLEDKVNQGVFKVKRMFEGADEKDETEAGICFIQYGVYNEDTVDQFSGNRIYIEDLTGMTDLF